jgi:hypothetical protein
LAENCRTFEIASNTDWPAAIFVSQLDDAEVPLLIEALNYGFGVLTSSNVHRALAQSFLEM